MPEYRAWPTGGGAIWDPDPAATAVGMEFYVTAGASAKALHIYRHDETREVGTVTLRLFRVDSASAGTLLSGPHTVGTAAGWNTITLPSAIALTINQRYRVVAHFSIGRYSATAGYFAAGGAGASGITNGPLVVPSAANATGNDQGSYAYGADGTFPINSFNGANYWVDVTVETSGAPTVSAGADIAQHTVSTAFTRTATETANGAAITARAWTIQSGPVGGGSTIGTAAALSWTPTTAGTYVLRYSATNSAGTGTDDMQIVVTAPPAPVVNPISAQVVDPHVDDQVSITATASGSPSSWTWTQLSGPTVTLTGTGATRTFTAPAVFGATSGTVVLGVTATNANGTSPQVQATVTVLPTLHATRVPGGSWLRATPTT